MTYTISTEEDEFYDSIDKESVDFAGLTYAPMGDNEYYDKLTCLRVTFGDGIATIK